LGQYLFFVSDLFFHLRRVFVQGSSFPLEQSFRRPLRPFGRASKTSFRKSAAGLFRDGGSILIDFFGLEPGVRSCEIWPRIRPRLPCHLFGRLEGTYPPRRSVFFLRHGQPSTRPEKTIGPGQFPCLPFLDHSSSELITPRFLRDRFIRDFWRPVEIRTHNIFFFRKSTD